VRYTIISLALLAACAPPAEPAAGVAHVVPDRLTLLGPAHGRAIALLDEDLKPASAEARSDREDVAVFEGGRVRARASGVARISFGEIELEVEVLAGPPPFAGAILEQTRGSGDGFGRDRLPEIILGPPKGVGPNQGSTDTLSLGLGGSITLAFEPYHLYDGPGPDLLIFENAFRVAGLEETFAEPARIAVGDGADFTDLPCDLSVWPYAGCAGVTPVLAGPARPELDPTDPESAGGDAFDLPSPSADRVRITDVATGTITGDNSGFDLDAIALVHVLPSDVVRIEPALAEPASLRPLELALIPRIDAVRANGEKIRGIAVELEVDPLLELLDGTRVRALAPGRAELRARAGDHTATITFDIL
jgi:hypothetical protein